MLAAPASGFSIPRTLTAFTRNSAALSESLINGHDDSFYTIETHYNGPADQPVHTLTIDIGDTSPLILQTGKIGRLAAGAITLTRGKTVVYATAARDDDPKDEIDFLPLSVEHQERFSSAGMTSGSYNKRDGRAGDHEILTCRLIDRPLRPLIAKGWRHETQLLSWVLSYDGLQSCDPLAITASAAACYISDIPLTKPVAGANVGYVDGQFILNPTDEQMEVSSLHLTVAGTKDAVLMIEGAADFLPEATMIAAVKFGHEAVQKLCAGIEALAALVGNEKKYDTILPPIEGLQEKVDSLFSDRIDAMYALTERKQIVGKVMNSLYTAVIEELSDDFPGKNVAIKGAFKDLLCRRMFIKAKNTGLRCDGRALDQIRRLDMETGFLPRVHGSALFTRGETQTIATATLGDSGMKQKIDKIGGLDTKRFYLQYTFPPSCVGETGRVGAPGRREVGHGNLAERALIPTLPDEATFPYSIRLESLVTESHGSSSMASVCGGCLALMDAGVPIKKPVAGIAMGMLLGDSSGVSDENSIILSDILGTEDALGTMDFKVAGDDTGITTFQLDIKCEGLTVETMERALEQARVGRIHLLEAMAKCLPTSRSVLPDTVPKMAQFKVEPDSIGKIIGPGGKQIRAIIEDFGLTNMDVIDDGSVQITGMDMANLTAAEAFVKSLVAGGGGGRGGREPRAPKAKYAGPDAEIGMVYKGKITGIHAYGVFVEILPGAEDGTTPGLEGLCHISELHTERVRSCEGFMKSLGVEELEVKLLGINDKGQLMLSRKAVLEGTTVKGVIANDPLPKSTMSDEEVDAIAQAIEGLNESFL